MEVYENQRKKQPWGWGSGRKRHLRTSDPGRFSDHKGENRLHVKLLEQVGEGRRGRAGGGSCFFVRIFSIFRGVFRGFFSFFPFWVRLFSSSLFSFLRFVFLCFRFFFHAINRPFRCFALYGAVWAELAIPIIACLILIVSELREGGNLHFSTHPPP